MAEFDSGVNYYTSGTVNVPIHFPEKDVCCKWCKMFLRYEENFKRYSCRLTEEWIINPHNQIGIQCPIVFKEKE